MNEDLPLTDLLNRVAQQDVAALGELYDRYAPRVYGVIVHIISARDAAEEILQQVFVQLWSECPKLGQEGGSVAAWLVVTARAAAVDRLRVLRNNSRGAGSDGSPSQAEKKSGSGRRRPRTAPAKSANGKSEAAKAPALRLLPTAWMPQPGEISMIDERLVLLHKAINQLPKPQLQALELAVFKGFSESEIAAETREPLGKVRTSLRAAVTFVKHRRWAVCGTWAANI